MSHEAVLLTPTTIIADGGFYRLDCDGVPRFYRCRITQVEPRNGHARVCVRMELEGDASAWMPEYCDDDDSSINEAAHEAIASIEDLCMSDWDREAEESKRDCLTNYERSFGY